MAEGDITDIAALEALYGTPSEASLVKVAKTLTPLYEKWIMASRLCVVSTVGPDGTDGSPRGDKGPVVLELDPGTLAMPDWRGNNRMDTLRNIVADGRVSLLFMVPGSTTGPAPAPGPGAPRSAAGFRCLCAARCLHPTPAWG